MTKSCIFCDKQYLKTKLISIPTWKKRKYCSVSCSTKHRAEKFGKRVVSEEFREKMRKIALGRKKISEETRERMRKANKGRNIGEKHWNWQGGISKNKKLRSWTKNKRNRMKRSNGGLHTYGEWETLKAQYNWTCPSCDKKEPKISLTRDHIIPISRGGSDNIENIQPLCGSCNSRKNNKIVKKYERN